MDRHPIAVLISDIHFTVNTLIEAHTSFLRAQFKAKMLSVPLVIAGDTLDSKAVMRAECVNRLLSLVSVKDAPEMIFLVGNHDLCNEKGKEHSLNFLKPFATIIETPQYGMLLETEVALIPYQSDKEQIANFLRYHEDEDHSKEENDFLRTKHRETIVIMHQGITGSNSGEYFQDHTALNKEDLAGFRVISGHYHARQTIELPEGGKFDYIGNPYTLGFGEVNDPEKGFQILYSDGSLEFVPTNLRKHVIWELKYSADHHTYIRSNNYIEVQDNDLLWARVRGPSDELMKISKEWVKSNYAIKQDIRLDLIPAEEVISPTKAAKPQTQTELMDSIIDSLNVKEERKHRLKQLYKGLL